MIKFSVVIPLYNKENYISKTLNSVLSQSYEHYEVIIVDDGSTDKSLEKIKKFKDDRLKIFKQENQGASAARNKGIELAKHHWIAFLDADDIWYSNHLEALKKSISSFKDAEVVSNAYEIQLDKNFIKTPAFRKPLPKNIIIIEDYFEYSLIDPLFWTSSMGVRKERLLEVGGFDVDISSGQDTDLICRLALNSRLVYNPMVTFLHLKKTENNLSKSNLLIDRLKVIEKLKPYECSHLSLKKYLDINRFSLAMQAQFINDYKTYKNLKKDINLINLNIKQRFLIKCPRIILITFKRLQKSLLSLGIYKSAFK